MVIESPEINKVIRRILSPTLRDTGFMHVRTRNNWAWNEEVIWVFQIRAVGKYFSSVTGWPSISVGVWLGAFYTFFPIVPYIRRDSSNRLLPNEEYCQMRSHLLCTIDQAHYKAHLKTHPEKARNDIWWLEPDGSNIEVVVQNIKEEYLAEGTQWFTQMSDFQKVFRLIEQERDCYNKYRRAAYFAKRLEDHSRLEYYHARWKEEAHKKDLPYESDFI